MTDTGDENDNNLFRLVTKVKPPAEPHKFGSQKRIAADKTLSGSEQIERTCASCGLVKITIMQGGGRRFYRWGDARCQFEEPVEPECAPTIEIIKGREAAE